MLYQINGRGIDTSESGWFSGSNVVKRVSGKELENPAWSRYFPDVTEEGSESNSGVPRFEEYVAPVRPIDVVIDQKTGLVCVSCDTDGDLVQSLLDYNEQN